MKKDQNSGKEKELSPAQKFTVARKFEEDMLLEHMPEKFFYRRRALMDQKHEEDNILRFLQGARSELFPNCREVSSFDTPQIKRAIKATNKRRVELYEKAVDDFWENRSRIDY